MKFISSDNPVIGKKIVELGFPKTAIIALLKSQGEFITPKGTTEILQNDQLLVLAEDKAALESVYENLNLPLPGHEEEDLE